MTTDLKELLERVVKGLQVAENMGDVRDVEDVWLYPAILALGHDPYALRYPDEDPESEPQ